MNFRLYCSLVSLLMFLTWYNLSTFFPKGSLIHFDRSSKSSFVCHFRFFFGFESLFLFVAHMIVSSAPPLCTKYGIFGNHFP